MVVAQGSWAESLGACEKTQEFEPEAPAPPIRTGHTFVSSSAWEASASRSLDASAGARTPTGLSPSVPASANVSDVGRCADGRMRSRADGRTWPQAIGHACVSTEARALAMVAGVAATAPWWASALAPAVLALPWLGQAALLAGVFFATRWAFENPRTFCHMLVGHASVRLLLFLCAPAAPLSVLMSACLLGATAASALGRVNDRHLDNVGSAAAAVAQGVRATLSSAWAAKSWLVAGVLCGVVVFLCLASPTVARMGVAAASMLPGTGH